MLKGIIITVLLFIAGACNNEALETQIISTYTDGMPMVVAYYKFDGNLKYKAIEVRLLPNGAEESRVNFNPEGKHHGKSHTNYSSGNRWMEEEYQNGLKHGSFKVWYRNGNLEYKGKFKNGLPDNVWVFYNANGKKVKEVTYNEGKEIAKTEY